MTDRPSDTTMPTLESIGPYLKKIRETQGLSLDQVASLTRIQPKFLQALEDEDFEALPEQVFARGFVRTYAKSLNISEEDALRRFSESSHEFYHRGQQAQQQIQLQIQEEQRGKLNRNVVIIVTIIIIVALGFLLPKEQQSSPTPAPADQASVPSNRQPKDPVSPVSQAARIEPESKASKNSSTQVKEEVSPVAEPPKPRVSAALPPPPPPPVPEQPKLVQPASTEPIRLEIEATQLTWVVVQSDDASPKEALLQPGQRATWEARQQFTLTLGNAAGATVRLNGEPRGPFGKPGEVVREVVLTP
ncbi:MAG: DUF4115 domain-containing protein [Nitrospirales bacterium]|nr:helix-turn-helix domain-containing protein [Nitrospira sp.]MDR4501185.1 DUF4115 domain-containing protein [Nitrospirales bacterium]